MRTIVHPGFLKTATTTLQDHLFGAHPGLFSIGLPHHAQLHVEIGNEFRKIDGVDYQEDKLSERITRALNDKPPQTVT